MTRLSSFNHIENHPYLNRDALSAEAVLMIASRTAAEEALKHLAETLVTSLALDLGQGFTVCQHDDAGATERGHRVVYRDIEMTLSYWLRPA